MKCDDVIKPPSGIFQRAIYMLLFAFLLGVAKFVIFTVVIVQFLLVVVTGSVNSQLLRFGQSLSMYNYQILLFLTFNSETHPFPLSDWPSTPGLDEKSL